jgi:hypothetical protein
MPRDGDEFGLRGDGDDEDFCRGDGEGEGEDLWGERLVFELVGFGDGLWAYCAGDVVWSVLVDVF